MFLLIIVFYVSAAVIFLIFCTYVCAIKQLTCLHYYFCNHIGKPGLILD